VQFDFIEVFGKFCLSTFTAFFTKIQCGIKVQFGFIEVFGKKAYADVLNKCLVHREETPSRHLAFVEMLLRSIPTYPMIGMRWG
jgi:hypothetical protein